MSGEQRGVYAEDRTRLFEVVLLLASLGARFVAWVLHTQPSEQSSMVAFEMR